MNTTQKTTPPGFQSLADLRALVLAHGELREAAALGLPLPPPSDANNAQAPRKDARTEAR